jgi:hypothetical protein
VPSKTLEFHYFAMLEGLRWAFAASKPSPYRPARNSVEELRVVPPPWVLESWFGGPFASFRMRAQRETHFHDSQHEPHLKDLGNSVDRPSRLIDAVLPDRLLPLKSILLLDAKHNNQVNA